MFISLDVNGLHLVLAPQQISLLALLLRPHRLLLRPHRLLLRPHRLFHLDLPDKSELLLLLHGLCLALGALPLDVFGKGPAFLKQVLLRARLGSGGFVGQRAQG